MPYAVVEIKHSSAPSLQRGYFSSVEDLQPKHQYIAAPVEEGYLLREGIRVVGPGALGEVFS